MVYIYIGLRYQRQLNRICPEVLETFFSSLASSVHRNGGTEIWISGGHLFQFDDRSIGYAFASSRVIGDMHTLLEENKNRIKEYFILIDSFPEAVTSDDFSDSLALYASIITPPETILIAPAAKDQLDPYILFTELAEIQLFSYLSPKLVEMAPVSSENISPNTVILTLYTDFITDPVSTFRNMVCNFPKPDLKEMFTDEERSLFSETRYALEMYSRFRFSPHQPEFRVAACLDYLDLFFKSLKGDSESLLPVTVYGTKPLPSSFSIVMDKLEQYCLFGFQTEPAYIKADFNEIPADLLEMSYLIYTVSTYLYMDELSSFFDFLGKQSDFLKSLGKLMHNFGFLLDPHDFRSLNPVVFPEIIEKLGTRCGQLDGYIARFLWLQYEKGLLQPVFTLYKVFTDLDFPVPDSFLVNCLYHTSDPGAELVAVKSRFLNPLLAQAIEELELAGKKFDDGLFEESVALAKNVLHVFQKENVLTGEYRALSLVAMLSLARNRGDDAVVYLEYALENAVRMHDSFSILSTSFDMAMVYFINGNFHFALCTLDTLEKIIGTCYAKDWEVLLFFMKGRISFELGDYRNAELLFQSAASLASISQISESVSLCRVWYARSLAHLNRFASADNILAGCTAIIPEAFIFLLESALISGRAVSGIVFPENISSFFMTEDCWVTGKISWKSGFSFAEDRCFGSSGEKRLIVRMYEAFSLYYRSSFNSGGNVLSAVGEISRIARTALDLKDPYAAVYYYFCYDLGKKTVEVLPADTMTFLSRGFKYMQKRANEIEDNSIREQFMQNSTWNSRLYRNARENMLI